MCILSIMKNESGFRIRVKDELRQAFIETCRKKDLSAAQVLRNYMRHYIEQSGTVDNQLGLFEISESNNP